MHSVSKSPFDISMQDSVTKFPYVSSWAREPIRLRSAKDALQDDPVRRLAILVSRDDTDGCGWQHWCRVEGDKYAVRANTWFNLIPEWKVRVGSTVAIVPCFPQDSKSTKKRYGQGLEFPMIHPPLFTLLGRLQDLLPSIFLLVNERMKWETGSWKRGERSWGKKKKLAKVSG